MALFEPGKQFPPQEDIERIAKYKRMRKIFDGKQAEVYERASEILKDTPHADQLRKLYIAANIIDAIVTKPADMLVGEKPTFDSGKPGESESHKAVSRIVEENDLIQLIHEAVVGAGIRGDSWIKVRYGYREDFSALKEAQLIDGDAPDWATPEPIIEHVNASCVFPEIADGDVKRFKAINIAHVEHVDIGKKERSFLRVERHLPGYIIYKRFELHHKDVDTQYGVPIPIYVIGDQVSTGYEKDVVETGAPYPLVVHIPYKSLDDQWAGQGGIEKVESLLAAINDRLVQIDYILWKHSDPIMYGPPIGSEESTRISGKYIELEKDDQTPGYLTWSSQLESAFKQLDYLLGLVFQISETPDWLFGTSVIGDGNKIGGTSHTNNAAIKARYLPIISKVSRIRNNVDRAIRDAIWLAQIVEVFANKNNPDFTAYEPVYPVIKWKDGIPRDYKEDAEIANIRTGGKPTLDVKTAIRRLDDIDDIEAQKIIDAIEEDEARVEGTVDASIFREPSESEAPEAEAEGGDE